MQNGEDQRADRHGPLGRAGTAGRRHQLAASAKSLAGETLGSRIANSVDLDILGEADSSRRLRVQRRPCGRPRAAHARDRGRRPVARASPGAVRETDTLRRSGATHHRRYDAGGNQGWLRVSAQSSRPGDGATRTTSPASTASHRRAAPTARNATTPSRTSRPDLADHPTEFASRGASVATGW